MRKVSWARHTVMSDCSSLHPFSGQRLLPSNDPDGASGGSAVSGGFMMFALAVFAVKGFNLSFCE